MARSLLFGTSVSPGIAIGVLRFAHNVQTVEMRRISPREVEGYPLHQAHIQPSGRPVCPAL